MHEANRMLEQTLSLSPLLAQSSVQKAGRRGGEGGGGIFLEVYDTCTRPLPCQQCRSLVVKITSMNMLQRLGNRQYSSVVIHFKSLQSDDDDNVLEEGGSDSAVRP